MSIAKGNSYPATQTPPRRRRRVAMRRRSLLSWLLAGLFGASWFVALTVLTARCVSAQDEDIEFDAQAAVQAGRDALQGRTYYPWYDAEADEARRVSVTPAAKPPEPTNPNWRWPEWKGWNMNWSLGDIFWTALQVIFWGIIIAVFVFLIVLLTRVFLGRESAAAVTSDESQHIETGAVADRIEHLPFDVRRPLGDLLSEARRLYEQGEYSQAVVYYFSYLLVEMDRRQVIRLTRGKTNRQYLREVRRQRREVAGLVERTMIAFEDVFFGDHALDRERFEACWRELDDFQRHMQPTA